MEFLSISGMNLLPQVCGRWTQYRRAFCFALIAGRLSFWLEALQFAPGSQYIAMEARKHYKASTIG